MKTTTLFLLAVLALTLSACAGEAASPPSLDGEWRLVSYGDAGSPTAALPDVETSITFGADGQFGGTVGCNTFGAEFKMGSDQITFGSIFSTEMFCENVDGQERAVLDMLTDKTVTFTLAGNTLTLESVDGASVVVLEKK